MRRGNSDIPAVWARPALGQKFSLEGDLPPVQFVRTLEGFDTLDPVRSDDRQLEARGRHFTRLVSQGLRAPLEPIEHQHPSFIIFYCECHELPAYAGLFHRAYSAERCCPIRLTSYSCPTLRSAFDGALRNMRVWRNSLSFSDAAR